LGQHVGPIFRGQAVILFDHLLRLTIPWQLRLEKLILIMEFAPLVQMSKNFSKNLEATSKLKILGKKQADAQFWSDL